MIKNIKSASELLKEIMPDTSQRLDDFTSFWIEQAMKAYAEQVIDICAEKALDCVESYDDGGDSDSIASDYYINCQPIIDVKKLLK
jgi:hypothetical protein